MSQYSRFIRPGFFRVAATQAPQRDVYVSAYTDGVKVVIVAINGSSGRTINQTFATYNDNLTHFTPYVSSSSKNSAQESDIVASNGFFTTTLEPASITTFVSE